MSEVEDWWLPGEREHCRKMLLWEGPFYTRFRRRRYWRVTSFGRDNIYRETFRWREYRDEPPEGARRS